MILFKLYLVHRTTNLYHNYELNFQKILIKAKYEDVKPSLIKFTRNYFNLGNIIFHLSMQQQQNRSQSSKTQNAVNYRMYKINLN